jgi:hypothetical protein
LAVAWIQSAVSGPERKCSYSRSAGGWIDDGVDEKLELRSEIHGVERSDDATFEMAARRRTGVVLVLRRIVGSSFLGGARFLRGGFDTVAATSSVTGAVLVCDYWWKW